MPEYRPLCELEQYKPKLKPSGGKYYMQLTCKANGCNTKCSTFCSICYDQSNSSVMVYCNKHQKEHTA